MKRFYLPFLIAICMSVVVQAQTPLARLIGQEKERGAAFERVSLFQAPQDLKHSGRYGDILKTGFLLQPRAEAFQELLENRPHTLRMDLPFSVSVLLVQEDPISEDFFVTAEDSRPIAYTPGVYYRGIVEGDESSLVAISVFDGEVFGVINSGRTGTIVIGKLGDVRNQEHVCYRAQDLLITDNFECGTEEPDYSPEELRLLDEMAEGVGSRNPNKCIRVYFECEYQLYVEKQSNTTTVTNFVTGLYNVVSTLYANESVTTIISQIFIWTTPDSYPTTSTSAALSAFRSARPTVNGNLAHLLSRGAPTGGGVAYLAGLCNGWGYAYSYINSGYNNFPTYSWTVNVVTHEMGHNLNSPHTHNCSAWSGGAIDGCGPTAGYTEGSCTPPPLPAQGTIMSYCHLISGVGINPALGFGIQPGNRIRSYINSASCPAPCVPGGCPTLTFNKTNVNCFGAATGSATVVTTGGTSPYTYLWSNGATSATVNGLTAGNYTVSVTAATGCSVNASVSITQPATALSSSVVVTPATTPTTPNGAINLSVSGGTPGYLYFWNTGATTQDISGLLPGTYSVSISDANGCQKVQVAVVSSGPSGESSCLTTISQFPHTEGFETPVSSWTQLQTDNFDWVRLSSETPTRGTGPDFAYQGVFFAYTEADLGSGTGSLISPCFNLSSLNIPVFELAYHLFGGQIGTLNVQVSTNGGSTWSAPIWVISGDQGDVWHTKTISLANYANQTIRLRVNGIVPSFAILCDIGVDAFYVGESPCDPPTLTLNANPIACFGGNTGSITTQLSGGTTPYTYAWSNGATTPNISNLSAGAYSVSVVDGQGCIASGFTFVSQNTEVSVFINVGNTSGPGVNDGILTVSASGGIPGYTYLWNTGATTATISNLAPGTYSATATDSQGCTKTGSATVSEGGVCNPTFQIPHSNGFENGANGWEQGTSDNFDWTVFSGETPTRGTGPDAAFESNFYLYTEADGIGNGQVAHYISPCFDLSGATNPQLSFAYHLFGASVGTLSVQISVDGGNNWLGAWSLSGAQGESWFQTSVSLSPYVGETIRVRFSGSIGLGPLGDIGIDAISITDQGGTPVGNEPAAWHVYPNPAKGVLYLEPADAFGSLPTSISLVDAMGRVVLQRNASEIANNDRNGQIRVAVNSLQSGVYFVVIEQEGQNSIQRIVVMQ